MKKLLSFALILMVCCTSALLFAGCDSNSTIIKMNETESAKYEFEIFAYNKNDSGNRTEQEQYEDYRLEKLKTLTITVYTKDGQSETEDANNKGITLAQVEERGGKVSGFSLKYTGTRTATVTYMQTSTSFQYTVKAKAK